MVRGVRRDLRACGRRERHRQGEERKRGETACAPVSGLLSHRALPFPDARRRQGRMSPANPPADRSRRDRNTPQEWNSVHPRGRRGAAASVRTWISSASITTSRSAILTLAGAAFSLQQTMVFPALRTFQDAFGSSTAWTTWVLTGFLVSGAVLTPILGRLGDQFGKERLLLISLGLFLAGCLGAAFAWSLWSLIAFRVVSGAGGALFPLSFAIIRDEFPPEQGEGRDRPALGGLGRRRRLRDRALRADRGQLLLALPLPARLDPGRPLARPRRAATCPSRRSARRRRSTCRARCSSPAG